MALSNSGDSVLLERHHHALIAGLNRPNRKNALNNESLLALDSALKTAEWEGFRTLLIRGTNTAFCAGSDVKELQAGDAEYRREHALLGQRVFDRLLRAPLLTVALIDGVCLGGGVELAMMCDMRLATPTTVWGFPEVALGAIPSWGGTQRLPRFVGTGRAKRMLLTGDRLTSRELAHTGLIDEIHDDLAEMTIAALDLAERVRKFPRASFGLIKELADASFEAPPRIGSGLERLADDQLGSNELRI